LNLLDAQNVNGVIDFVVFQNLVHFHVVVSVFVEVVQEGLERWQGVKLLQNVLFARH
jgi:hypothetical protein